MPIIKCKMCGGDIQLAEDKTFGTCEYCGSVMTLPRVSDEQRAAAFNRGNHFRRAGEFDKALGVYEHIVADDDTDAEAHWCCALCRFGIEYVEDPATYEWLPTCHRASFDSFLEDVDYLAALEHSDGITRRQYQKDAAKIAEVQRGILAASQNTEPYDVFISYKELDANGERTRDSILAQEIYYRLTEKGWRVFFSRISLEDVPGTQYEPYIFAALNSAKVMVVVGTSAENLNAVWVKNEWSRFLAMMRKDRSKLLIPCYRDMDPYDLPEQLSVLMSYDMGKIGFIQDLIRGVDKVLSAEKKDETVRETVKETVVVQQSGDSAARITAAMDRGFMALEDSEWNKAVSFFDQVLSLDAKNARAYYGMALAKVQCKDASAYIDKLCAFTPKSETIELPVDEEHIREAAEKYAVSGYLSAEEIKILYDYKPSYQSTERSQKQLNENACSSFEKSRDLTRARQFATGELKTELEHLREILFNRLDEAAQMAEAHANKSKADAERNYQTFLASKDMLVVEKKRKAEAKCKAEAEEAERQRIAKETAEKAENEHKVKKNRRIIIVIAIMILAGAGAIIYQLLIVPAQNYKAAEVLFESGKYNEALKIFESLGGYKDSQSKSFNTREAILNRDYASAEALLESGNIGSAAIAFYQLGNYRDAKERSRNLWEQVSTRSTIAAGDCHSVGLKMDGTVIAVGGYGDGQLDVKDWKNIVSVAVGDSCTFGLKDDGSVNGVGWNIHGQCEVSDWKDIVQVSSGREHTVGLKADGTVIATQIKIIGNSNNDRGQCDVSEWENVIAIDTGKFTTVGLKADGTVVAAGFNEQIKKKISEWRDVVKIACNSNIVIGLKRDGSIVATPLPPRFDVLLSYHDIVSVAVGQSHVVCLRQDGTVIAAGEDTYGACDVSTWTDIVAIAAGDFHTLGLKSDGSVIATEFKGSLFNHGQCNVSKLKDIQLPSK